LYISFEFRKQVQISALWFPQVKRLNACWLALRLDYAQSPIAQAGRCPYSRYSYRKGRIMMNIDNFMIVMILGGIALCGAYFRSLYMDWRSQQTAEAEKKIQVRLLYQDELSRPQESVVAPVVDLASVRVNAAIPKAVETAGRRPTLLLRNVA
jgi:hypothetical protein